MQYLQLWLFNQENTHKCHYLCVAKKKKKDLTPYDIVSKMLRKQNKTTTK